MARAGPLLASVLGLADVLDPEEILRLPVPPLPVRLWVDERDGRLRVDLLIGFADLADQRTSLALLAESGVRIGTLAGRAATGSAALDELGRVLDNNLDVTIDAAATARPSLDVSVAEAWNAEAGTVDTDCTGAGVAIGIVDSGIDVTHQSFRTASGATRLLALKNQVLRGQRSEWDARTINRCLLRGSSPDAMLDASGHGTAVAGIAAGNGFAAPAGRYVGVAPSADLIVVAIQAPRQAYGSTANVVDAVRYIFEYCEQRGQRVVVNVSQGVQIGAHDPAGALERAFSALLDRDENRIVVASAGNTGDAGAHARLSIGNGQQADLAIDVPAMVGPLVLIDIWYDVADELELTVLAPDGSRSPAVGGTETRWFPIGESMCEIAGVPNDLSVRANNVHVKLRTSRYRGDLAAGRWTLQLDGVSMTSGADVHAWLDRGWLSSPSFDSAVADGEYTVTSPATADGVLAVGSYLVTPSVGALASSSGRGPSRVGRPVDLIAAPGETITTCAASPQPGAAHTRRHGTSLAAAHVTGAVALLLEANPGLTRAQALECLTAGARTDGYTAAGPASGWGAGKLDITAALDCARSQTREP